MPLTFRFSPPIGGILYWLRPGTVRLPPWPDRVPLTARHHARTLARRRALRGRARALPCYLLLADGEPAAGAAAGRLDPAAVAVAARLPRRCSACATRSRSSPPAPEVYGPLLIVFLFPLSNLIVAAQIVFVCIWWGAASLEAQPPLPVRRLGDDQQHAVEPLAQGEGAALPRPPRGPAARRGGRRSPPTSGTVMEFALPLLAASSRSGGRDRDARRDRDGHLPRPHHLDVPARRPAGVEPLHDLRAPVPVRPLRRRAALDPRRPAADRDPAGRSASGSRCSATSGPTWSRSCPSMRYYAGNWATSQWLLPQGHARPRSRLDREVTKAAPIVIEQLTQLYDRETRRAAAQQGARVPRDALARPGAERPPARAPSTTSRPTTCARASWSRASSTAGTSATATSTTSSCSARCRSAAASSRASCGSSRSSPSRRTSSASATGSSTPRPA